MNLKENVMKNLRIFRKQMGSSENVSLDNTTEHRTRNYNDSTLVGQENST